MPEKLWDSVSLMIAQQETQREMVVVHPPSKSIFQDGLWVCEKTCYLVATFCDAKVRLDALRSLITAYGTYHMLLVSSAGLTASAKSLAQKHGAQSMSQQKICARFWAVPTQPALRIRPEDEEPRRVKPILVTDPLMVSRGYKRGTIVEATAMLGKLRIVERFRVSERLTH